MAAVAGRPGPWLPGARYGNLCMPAFRLSLRTAVTAPSLRCLWSRPGYWRLGSSARWTSSSIAKVCGCSTPVHHHAPPIGRLSGDSAARAAGPGRDRGSAGALHPGDLRPIYGYLTRSFTELYAQHHQISLLSFGGVQGEYTGVRLEPDGHYRLILQDRSTQGTLQIFEGLQPGPPMSSLAGYDPRVRPWYQPAIREDGPHWSPIYTVTGTGVMPRFPQPLRCVCPASWPACWPPMCG